MTKLSIIVLLVATVCIAQTVKPALTTTAAPWCCKDCNRPDVPRCKTSKAAKPVSLVPQCKLGEYLSIDGRCLHNQKGEVHPAGDGCNSATCMDAACHFQSQTAMACIHGDDPAFVVDAEPMQQYLQPPTYTWTFLAPPESPCGKYEGAELGKDGKCHSETVLWPAGWTCEIPMNKPDSGKPTVLRCTWEPTK
jgi:hypothetical protein